MSYSGSITTKVFDFLEEIIRSVRDGYLFFGSSVDIARYIIDILLIAFLTYCLLVFLKQTRAWQLIKGILLILFFVIVCSLLGLEMVGFIFNKLLYVIAFAIIVIFQPELRRVLETMGISTFGKIKSTFGGTSASPQSASLINEICSACKEMSKSYTGALILIERTTSLEELLSQENVVRMDSSVSSSVLQSIFYKGAPMHDGAVLIRNNRIVATRCHVPLSVTMQQLERSGTRHRAAVGASEIGDTIAVVVSEERGKTSIAVNGRLFEMKDSKELEANLAYLFGLSDEKVEKSSTFSSFFKGNKSDKVQLPEDDTITKKSKRNKKTMSIAVASVVEEGRSKAVTSTSGSSPVIKKYSENQRTKKISLFQRIVFMLLSLIMSFGLWVYIQINNNPIIEKTMTIPITYPQNIDLDVSYNVATVDVTVVGRQSTISMLDTNKLTATYDYSQVNETGTVDLPIIIIDEADDLNVYYRVIRTNPDKGMVNVYSLGDK